MSDTHSAESEHQPVCDRHGRRDCVDCFEEAVGMGPYASDKPVIAERLHDDGTLDDFVAKRVTTIHAEQLDAGLLWIGIYFANGERLTLNVHANRKNDLTYAIGERPNDWIDLDALSRNDPIWKER